MQAILLFSAVYIILIFPLFVSGYFLFDEERKRLYFSISLFGCNILGGYAVLDILGISFFIGNKKYRLKFEDYLMKRKKISKVKGAGLYEVKSSLICGIENINFVKFALLSQFLNENLMPVLKEKYNYLRLKNDIALVGNDKIYLVANLKVFTNIFSLLIYLISKLIEKVMNGKQKQRTKSN